MGITDVMFYEACIEATKYSRCLSRQIGAVVVKHNIIQAMGYNGPPVGIEDCNRGWYKEKLGRVVDVCPRQHMDYKSGEGLQYCIAVHAERSALIHAARNGVKTSGCTMYMTCGVPCGPCMVEIIEAGITELVVTDIENYYDVQSEYLLKKSHIDIRKWELDA